MRQSAYNKQWVEGEFSSDSRKVSKKQSPREDKVEDLIIAKKRSMNEYNFKEKKELSFDDPINSSGNNFDYNEGDS